MKGKSQSVWVLVLLLLAGIVLGGFVGELLGSFPALKWLAYGKTFGTTMPIVIELGVLTLQLGLQIRITVAGILGMAVAFLAYRKM